MKMLFICAGMMMAATALAQTPAQVPATGQAAAPQASDQPNPAEAVEDVKRAVRETDLPSDSIIVSTHADTVVLTGQVDSKVDAARAVSVAEAALDGKHVASQLEVRPEKQAAASKPSPVRNVQEALKQDSRTANLGIMVSVDELQVIGLHGLVPTRENSRAAEAVAKRASGNQPVRNYLKVPSE